MPAEWEPHEATWLAWPHNRQDWPGKFAPIPWVYADIIRHLHTGEIVRLMVNEPAAEKRARRVLTRAGVDLSRVEFFHIATDRVWTRDYGPMFVVSDQGELGINNWHFNGWAKYDNWRRDDEVPFQVAQHLGIRRLMSPTQSGFRDSHIAVLEGGAIDVNGAGCLLTTEECLLSDVQQRNPGMSRADYEQAFARHLDAHKTLWLRNGVAGDDTHGHVDDLARFVAPSRVVVAVEEDRADPNHAPLQENLRLLCSMTDGNSRRLAVVQLPMPRPIVFDGQRLPASYANFYIGNEKVLVPTFNDAADRIALGILADQFPDRTVVGIHALDLVWGLGTLHCMTQQQPAASLA
jgi:agmatine deiminase